MTEIYNFDSPLTRLKQEYEEKLAVQTNLATEAMGALAIAHEEAARVRATRDMLVLLMRDMGDQVASMQAQLSAMHTNIDQLHDRLKELPG